MYSRTILEVRSLKLRCWLYPSGGSRGKAFLAGFRAHLEIQVSSSPPPNLKILNYISKDYPSFPNKIMFTDSRDSVWTFWGGGYFSVSHPAGGNFCSRTPYIFLDETVSAHASAVPVLAVLPSLTGVRPGVWPEVSPVCLALPPFRLDRHFLQ